MTGKITIRYWKHKETGKEYKVLPWWECEGTLMEAHEAKKVIGGEDDDWTDRLYAVGCLVQVGWLIENDDGAWIGVGPRAKDQFEEVGT